MALTKHDCEVQKEYDGSQDNRREESALGTTTRSSSNQSETGFATKSTETDIASFYNHTKLDLQVQQLA